MFLSRFVCEQNLQNATIQMTEGIKDYPELDS